MIYFIIYNFYGLLISLAIGDPVKNLTNEILFQLSWPIQLIKHLIT